jgi:hypothetical protein
MAEELSAKYVSFFLNSKASIVELELIELSHPNFSVIYRIVRNAVNGVTVTLETGEVAFFDYYPLSLEGSTVQEDLDYIITIKVGDLGEIIPAELDRISVNDGFSIKPKVIYRLYRSDDLSEPMFGPLLLEISEFNFIKDGAEFEAKAPLLNISRTGELYSLNRFPMLRGNL